MKKLLFIFVLLDIIFVGLILKYSGSPGRMISSIQNAPSNLSEGQKNKRQLVETFRFQVSKTGLEFETDKLQHICETSSLIELKFIAQNVAYGGLQPTISHTFSCVSIRENQYQTKLVTPLDRFKQIHREKKINLQTSEIIGSQMYSDEAFPGQWKLAEIKIIGANTFTVNPFELDEVHSESFGFDLATSAK